MSGVKIIYNQYNKKYDISELLDLSCPGVPATFRNFDYFEFSQNGFIKISDNKLYNGSIVLFEHYCKKIIPELFVEYKEIEHKYKETNDMTVWNEYNKKIDNLLTLCKSYMSE